MQPIEIILKNPPEGYEAEALFRSPVHGEKFLDNFGNVITATTDYPGIEKRIVLTPKLPPYQWPTINGKPMGGWGFWCDVCGNLWWR